MDSSFIASTLFDRDKVRLPTCIRSLKWCPIDKASGYSHACSQTLTRACRLFVR